MVFRFRKAIQTIYNDTNELMKLGNKLCIRVRRILNKTVTYCNETCIYVKKIYQYGNNFISFRNALGIALGTGIKKIQIDPNFIFLRQSFYYEGILIEVTTDHSQCIKHTYFNLPGNMHYLAIKQIPKLNSEFKSMYYKLFIKVEIPDDALVIHIRSGDVFFRKVHKLYGQPPCSYYIDVIKMKKWSKIFLISKDRRNPCVNVIESYTEKFNKKSFIVDIAVLLNAKNLVIKIVH